MKKYIFAILLISVSGLMAGCNSSEQDSKIKESEALQQKIRDREAVRRAAMTDDDTPPSKYEKRNFKY